MTQGLQTCITMIVIQMLYFLYFLFIHFFFFFFTAGAEYFFQTSTVSVLESSGSVDIAVHRTKTSNDEVIIREKLKKGETIGNIVT